MADDSTGRSARSICTDRDRVRGRRRVISYIRWVHRLQRACTMKRSAFVVSAALALGSAGFTDCQYFSQVRVVTNESTPPVVGARVWIDGVESMYTGDNWIHSTTGNVAIFPFGFDGGALRTLQLTNQEAVVYCHDDDSDPDLGQYVYVSFVNQSYSQPPATAGQMRSNGIYLIAPVNTMSDFQYECGDGFDLVDVAYTWTVRATDYSGNTTAATTTITYAP
jgi:hypothetical protein